MNLRKIRILFNVWADVDNVNAQSLNAREIALRLDVDRFESALFAQRPDPRLFARRGVRVIRLPRRLRSVVMARHLIWGRYDVLCYPSADRVMRWYRNLVRYGRPKHIVYSVEGPIGHDRDVQPEAYAETCRTLGNCARIVACSEFAADVLRTRTGRQADALIPIGVDTTYFSPTDRPDRTRTSVLFVGRLTERKGAGLVVRAAERFPEARFLLAGSAYDDRDRRFVEGLKHEVADKRLANVEFVGAVSQARVRELMWGADVLLHPSRIDGIPRATLEAAATGLPCVVFDDYRTPSVVDQVTGFQVSAFDEMLARLQLLIEDPRLRQRMGKAAAEHMRDFDWRLIVPRWAEQFEAIVDGGGRDAADRCRRLVMSQ